MLLSPEFQCLYCGWSSGIKGFGISQRQTVSYLFAKEFLLISLLGVNHWNICLTGLEELAILVAEMDNPAHIFIVWTGKENYPLEWEIPVLHSLLNVFPDFNILGSSLLSEMKLWALGSRDPRTPGCPFCPPHGFEFLWEATIFLRMTVWVWDNESDMKSQVFWYKDGVTATLKLALEHYLKFNIPFSSRMGFKEWHEHAE